MGETIFLAAEDGHEFCAYRARPAAAALAPLVVLHEFFGLNHHIRNVADRFAALGYDVIVPGLFDRVERGIEFDYSPEGIEGGRRMRAKVQAGDSLKDAQAAIDLMKAAAGPNGRIGVIGYCWGGTLAFLSATRLHHLACAVGYYGSQIVDYLGERSGVPLMLHFGDSDRSIPLTDVERIRTAYPELPIHVHPGRHGFNCDDRANFVPESAAAALERTLAFFRRHLH